MTASGFPKLRLKRVVPWALGIHVALAAACSKSEEAPHAAAAPAAAATGVPPAGTKITGQAPAAGAGIPAIVVLNAKTPQDVPARTPRARAWTVYGGGTAARPG